MKKNKSAQEVQIINQELKETILNDLKRADVLYISAPIGWGKYNLLLHVYDNLDGNALWLEDTEQYSIEQRIEEIQQSDKRIVIIPRLEKIIQKGKIEVIQKLFSEKRKDNVFLIASEVSFPKDLLPYTLYYKVITYGIEDLKPSAKAVGEHLRKQGLKIDSETLVQIERDFNNMPLCIFMLEGLLCDTQKNYSPVMRERCMEDIYTYMDVMVFRKFKVAEQEQMLRLSCLENFDETVVAGMLDITIKQARELLQQLMDSGSVLVVCQGGWQFEPLFARYLKRVRYKYMDTDEVRAMYKKAMFFAREQKRWKDALCYAYVLENEEQIAEYLEKYLFDDVDYNVFLDLEDYFQELSLLSFMRHPVLMIDGAILELVNGNLKKAQEYEQMFRKYMQQIQQPVEKEMLQRMLTYLRLISIGAADMEELTAILTRIKMRAGQAVTRDGSRFKITQLSVLHGEKDYCDILAQKKYGNNIFSELRTLSEGILDDVFYVMYSYAEVELLYERNQLEQAINLLSHTVWESGTTRNQRMQQVCAIAMADLLVARNQMDNMEEFVSRRIDVTGQVGSLFADNVAAHQVYYYLLKNEQKKIMEWLQERAPDENSRFATVHYYQYLIKAKVYIWMKHYIWAKFILQNLMEFAENYGMRYLEMKVRILQAIVHYKESNEVWREMLIPALEYGEKIHFIRVFADEGGAVYELLQEIANTDTVWVEKPYFKEVLTAVRAHMLQYPKYMKQQTAVDISDFTSYEKDIMKLLANGDKNADIAKKLFVSENTVKYHLKNIYQKLEVKSRSQAVNKMKEYNLV